MGKILGIIIVFLFIIVTAVVFIKSVNGFIRASDPLAQEIFVIDNAKSPEIVKIKGELMRDLVRYYYTNRTVYDSIMKGKYESKKWKYIN